MGVAPSCRSELSTTYEPAHSLGSSSEGLLVVRLGFGTTCLRRWERQNRWYLCVTRLPASARAAYDRSVESLWRYAELAMCLWKFFFSFSRFKKKKSFSEPSNCLYFLVGMWVWMVEWQAVQLMDQAIMCQWCPGIAKKPKNCSIYHTSNQIYGTLLPK